jgi:hypothetical protein
MGWASNRPFGIYVGDHDWASSNVPEHIYWANFLERARIKSEEQASHITGARKQASASTISLWK